MKNKFMKKYNISYFAFDHFIPSKHAGLRPPLNLIISKKVL